jgi:hypothetical protein
MFGQRWPGKIGRKYSYRRRLWDSNVVAVVVKILLRSRGAARFGRLVISDGKRR